MLKAHASYVLIAEELNISWRERVQLNFPQIIGLHWLNTWQIGNWVQWNHMTIICWCNNYYLCACEGSWQWNQEWSLWNLLVFFDKFVWRLEPNWYWKSLKRCGKYIVPIGEIISSCLFWCNDSFIVACGRWVRCLWANSQSLDVSSGAANEGFKRLCMFHGMT
jgi:hypothetical protein